MTTTGGAMPTRPRVGAYYDNAGLTTHSFRVLIGDVKVFNRAVSASELEDIAFRSVHAPDTHRRLHRQTRATNGSLRPASHESPYVR